MLSNVYPGCLEQLVFGVGFVGGEQTDPSRGIAWHEVDAVLQGPAFSKLRTVYVHCIGQHQWSGMFAPGMIPYLPFWISAHMPECYARRSLHAIELQTQVEICL